MAWPKKGDVVEVTFLDHAEDSRDVLPFQVWGRVVRRSKDSLTIGVWLHRDAPGCRDSNTRTFTLVKRAVLHWRRLG